MRVINDWFIVRFGWARAGALLHHLSAAWLGWGTPGGQVLSYLATKGQGSFWRSTFISCLLHFYQTEAMCTWQYRGSMSLYIAATRIAGHHRFQQQGHINSTHRHWKSSTVVSVRHPLNAAIWLQITSESFVDSSRKDLENSKSANKGPTYQVSLCNVLAFPFRIGAQPLAAFAHWV